MKTKLSFLLILTLSVAVGCGPSTTSERVQAPSVAQDIKAGLSSMASSGQKDSGLVIVKNKIEQLKQEDAALGSTIATEFAGLESAKSAKDVKKFAQSIIDKLP